jgi:hypothetical protein
LYDRASNLNIKGRVFVFEVHYSTKQCNMSFLLAVLFSHCAIPTEDFQTITSNYPAMNPITSWHMKLAGIGGIIGASMEPFMNYTGFCKSFSILLWYFQEGNAIVYTPHLLSSNASGVENVVVLMCDPSKTELLGSPPPVNLVSPNPALLVSITTTTLKGDYSQYYTSYFLFGISKRGTAYKDVNVTIPVNLRERTSKKIRE